MINITLALMHAVLVLHLQLLVLVRIGRLGAARRRLSLLEDERLHALN